jgi:hypothetical protein
MYCYHEDGANHEMNPFMKCNEYLTPKSFDCSYTGDKPSMKNIKKKDTMYIKMYSMSCGESTSCMTITDDAIQFEGLEKKFQKDAIRLDGRLDSNNKMRKIQLGEAYNDCNCNYYSQPDRNQRFRNTGKCDPLYTCPHDTIIFCLVPKKVYLMATIYDEHGAFKLEYHQLFFHKLPCISESTFYDIDDAVIEKYIHGKFAEEISSAD